MNADPRGLAGGTRRIAVRFGDGVELIARPGPGGRFKPIVHALGVSQRTTFTPRQGYLAGGTWAAEGPGYRFFRRGRGRWGDRAALVYTANLSGLAGLAIAVYPTKSARINSTVRFWAPLTPGPKRTLRVLEVYGTAGAARLLLTQRAVPVSPQKKSSPGAPFRGNPALRAQRVTNCGRGALPHKKFAGTHDDRSRSFSRRRIFLG